MALEFTRWQDVWTAKQAAVRALNITPQQLQFAGRIERALASVEAADDANGH
jgi:hypothetical protein